MEETYELSPCPFCGAPNELLYIDRVEHESFMLNRTLSRSAVYCPRCGSYGPIKDTPDQAREAWNSAICRWEKK